MSEKMDTKKFKDPIFLFNAVVLVAFIILNFIADGYAEGARKFPKFVLGVGIIVIVLWMAIYFIFPKAMHFIETQEEADEGDVESPRRFYLACLCVVLSVLAGCLLGFLFLVPIAFLSYGFLLGSRKKLAALIVVTVITTVLFYFGFDYLLNIPLLKGVLWNFS
jgi:hypothetical protein